MRSKCVNKCKVPDKRETLKYYYYIILVQGSLIFLEGKEGDGGLRNNLTTEQRNCGKIVTPIHPFSSNKT